MLRVSLFERTDFWSLFKFVFGLPMIMMIKVLASDARVSVGLMGSLRRMYSYSIMMML